ncbi:sulfurtransferase [bacterium]|nr:MAG: sulfurtransferase [bacterium]
MGPLVPYIISDEMNLVIALFLGVAFGFVLEQAGFSSSRKLAGVFYGYDFTVLRVFFTAGVTAMSGIILFSYLGWIDTEAIYVNPTWLWPAIVGGAIMGVGFVVGGYCPGTSVCAMSIGKVDGLYFVGGGLAGVLLFGEFFPYYKEFFDSSALGPIKVFNSLGLPLGVFALLMIVVAIVAFAVTTKIEKRNNPNAPSMKFHAVPHRLGAAALLLTGVILLFVTDHKADLIAKATDADFQSKQQFERIAVDDLAFRLIDKHPSFQLIDVRPPEEYSAFALPRSTNIQLRELFGRDWKSILSKRHVTKIMVADSEADERAAYLLLKRLGYENLAILEGGLGGFKSQILDGHEFASTGGRWDKDVREFRAQARTEIAQMIEDNKNAATKVIKKKRKIVGGC